MFEQELSILTNFFYANFIEQSPNRVWVNLKINNGTRDKHFFKETYVYALCMKLMFLLCVFLVGLF